MRDVDYVGVVTIVSGPRSLIRGKNDGREEPCIGANCPGNPGTVPDLEALSRVWSGNHNLPELSWILKDSQIRLGCHASWKATWL